MIWIILGILVLAICDLAAWRVVTIPMSENWKEADGPGYVMFLIIWIGAHAAGVVVGGIMLIHYGVGQLA